MKVLYSDYRISPSAGDFVAGIKKQLPECEVECWQYTDDKTLVKKLENAVGLLTANLKVSEYVLCNSKSLKVISVDATGYGNINIRAAHENNILVCSIGAYCTEEVADHAMLLTLMLEKKVKGHLKNIEHKRIFDYKLCSPPHRIQGKNLVIFGYGRIGKSIAKRAAAFGYKVYAVLHNENSIGNTDGIASYISKDSACEIADVVINSLSETPETFEYFNKEVFESLKKAPLFINVGKGSTVNETDLLDAVNTGKVSGAGLDVMKEVYPDLDNSPFIGMDNVIITPHMAFYSLESVESIKTLPVNNLVNGILGNTEKISNIAE